MSMSIFKKIGNFFRSLFKKKEVVKEEEPVVSQQVAPESEEVAEEVLPIIETKNELSVVENPDPIEHQKEFAIISDELKDNILDVLRPVIKGFNTDEFFIGLCEKLCESKVLKTFSCVSSDGTELVIRLTQNNAFNSKIAEYINEHVIAEFKSKIDSEIFGEFEVCADDGIITIRKIG